MQEQTAPPDPTLQADPGLFSSIFRGNLTVLVVSTVSILALAMTGYCFLTSHPGLHQVLISLNSLLLMVTTTLLILLSRQHRRALHHKASLARETSKRIQSEKKYEEIINRTSGGFWLFDPADNRILEVNRGMCQLLDMDAEDLIGRVTTDFFTSRGMQRLQLHGQQLGEGKEESIETELRTTDGKPIAVAMNSSEFHDQQEDRSLRFSFFTEITAQKERQKQLQLFSRAVDQSVDAIVITNQEGVIEYVNPAFCRISGYRKRDVLGKTTRILVADDVDPAQYRRLWQTISQGRSWQGIMRNRNRDGVPYWEEVTISPIFDREGIVTHFINVKKDITQRKKLEKLLAENTKKLETIVQHAGFGIAMIANHQVRWCNEEMKAIFGYTDQEIRNLSTTVLYPNEQYAREVFREFTRCFLNKELFRKQMRMRRSDGSLFWVMATGKVINPENPSQGAIWICEDISDQVQAQKELIKAKEQAEAANRAKSEFLANMSHEIRTPLNGVAGMLHLMQATKPSRKQRHLLEKAIASTAFLNKIINDILDFSKIEAGQLQLDKHPFEIAALLKEVEDLFAPIAAEKGLNLVCQLDEEVPEFLVGDALRIQQVLTNLIGNSIKFTRRGGITVTVSNVTNHEDRAELLFRVEDTGMGIPADKISDIFQSFTQADGSITRKFGGTGLGLTICKRLVTLMEGEISVTSREGRGSCFQFTIPCEQASREALRTLATGEAGDYQQIPRQHILLVEDNDINRDVARMTLENDGHQVTTATNGLECLQKLLESSFSCILMDMQMPLMDGLTATAYIRQCEAGTSLQGGKYQDLLEKLRSRIAGSYTPIIALTANVLGEEKQQCLQAGMDDYLSKPFHPKELRRILWKYCEKIDREISAPSGGEAHSSTGPRIKAVPVEQIRNHLRSVYHLEEDQIALLLSTTATSLEETLSELDRAAGEQDGKGVSGAAHKLKGALLNLGLTDLAEQAGQLKLIREDETGLEEYLNVFRTSLADIFHAYSCG